MKTFDETDVARCRAELSELKKMLQKDLVSSLDTRLVIALTTAIEIINFLEASKGIK